MEFFYDALTIFVQLRYANILLAQWRGGLSSIQKFEYQHYGLINAMYFIVIKLHRIAMMLFRSRCQTIMLWKTVIVLFDKKCHLPL